MSLAQQIAQILFTAGIRLESESDTGALGFYLGDQVQREIENAVQETNAVLEVHATDINRAGFEYACRMAAMDYADGIGQQIDAELWALQLAERAAA